MSNITYEIVDTLASVESGDWTLELNLMSWNNGKSKYDLRKWSSDREKMSKGVTLTEDEVISLFGCADEILEKLGADCVPKVSDDDIHLPFDD